MGDWGKDWGKGKGKDKGKKGKLPMSPDASDPFWTEKVTVENRMESAEGSMFVGTVASYNLLYFRKPDVAEGYQPKKEAQVTFQVYTDDKGAGAFNIAGVDA